MRSKFENFDFLRDRHIWTMIQLFHLRGQFGSPEELLYLARHGRTDIPRHLILGGWKYHEKRHSSWLCWYRHTVCVWQRDRGRLDQVQYPRWNMLQMPSFFYRQTETDWHSGSHWTFPEKIWKISKSSETHLVLSRLSPCFAEKTSGCPAASDSWNRVPLRYFFDADRLNQPDSSFAIDNQNRQK